MFIPNWIQSNQANVDITVTWEHHIHFTASMAWQQQPVYHFNLWCRIAGRMFFICNTGPSLTHKWIEKAPVHTHKCITELWGTLVQCSKWIIPLWIFISVNGSKTKSKTSGSRYFKYCVRVKINKEGAWPEAVLDESLNPLLSLSPR